MSFRVLYILSVHIIFLSSFGECDVNSVKALPLFYTTESHSIHGNWCLNDCTDGLCVVDIDVVAPCHPSHDPAPKFYTTGQLHPDQSKCTSRCALLSGHVHARCFVDNNWDKIDYCNPDITRSFDYKDFTLYNGPCTNDCRPSASLQSHKGYCNDILGTLTECFIDKYLYERVKTSSGYICNGECKRHGGTTYSWCYYDSRSWDYCTRPALYNKACFNCTTELNRQLRETVSKYAARMERDPRLITVNVSDPNNPVRSYTYSETTTPNGPVKLPLVVRARVYRSHINPKNSRGNKTFAISSDARENCRRMGMAGDDIVSHLIAYKFGGPVDFYNFIPMARAINIGSERNGIIYAPSEWVTTERQVAEFVGNDNGQVEIVVVLRYNFKDHAYPYRPYRIGWGQWGLTSNGDVVLNSKNYWNTY